MDIFVVEHEKGIKMEVMKNYGKDKSMEKNSSNNGGSHTHGWSCRLRRRRQ